MTAGGTPGAGPVRCGVAVVVNDQSEWSARRLGSGGIADDQDRD